MQTQHDTIIALQELNGFDLFRFFRARANGLSEEESLAIVRALPERSSRASGSPGSISLGAASSHSR